MALILVLFAFFAAGQANAQKVVAGADHNLAVKSDGTVWAWGQNFYGQLGDGTTTIQRDSPVQVPGLTGVVALAAGQNHSLALKSNRTVWAWGRNSNGQLGNGTTTQRTSPVQVTGLGSDVLALAAGSSHSLALMSDRTVRAWGHNSHGQLGDGTTTQRTTPVQVLGLTDVKALVAGAKYSLALKLDGTVWAWGENAAGQLGDGTQTNRTSPVKVLGLDSVDAMAAGSSHSFALKSDGTVWAWGFNGYGQLGDGTRTNRTSPVKVLSLSGVRALVAASNYSLAVMLDGTVWAWGRNSNVMSLDRTTPERVPDLNDVEALAVGFAHCLAVKSNGSLWAWGSSFYGQLGDGRTTQRTSPVQVLDFSGVEALAANSSHSCFALMSDRTLWAWGDNNLGQLGDGTTTQRTTPVQVLDLSDVDAVTAGPSHSLALKSDGTVWAWGNNYSGQLGDGTNMPRISRVQVTSLGSDVLALAAGSSFSLALMSDRTVRAWGHNSSGQLGDGGAMYMRNTPVQVLDLTDVKALAAGTDYSFALKLDGTLWAWGDNRYGQLGDGTTMKRTRPVRVSVLSDVVSVAAGNSHSLAVKSDGTVWAWGNNASGHLGDGTTTQRTTPVHVLGLSGVDAVTAGSSYSLALKSDETVWAWGDNRFGQLGDGTTTSRTRPVRVPGLRGVVSMAGGSSASFALKEDSTILSWGSGSNGKLANGFGEINLEPRAVLGLNFVHPTPLIIMTSPANQALVPLGSSVTLQTNPTVATGSIAKVFFYADGIFLGEDATAPFSYTYTPESWGNLDINAIAVSSAGSYSLPANIRLQTPYDSDGDELPDWWELKYFTTLEQAANGDFDGDGILTADEIARNLNPYDADTDGDGILDGADELPLDPQFITLATATSIHIWSPLE